MRLKPNWEKLGKIQNNKYLKANLTSMMCRKGRRGR